MTRTLDQALDLTPAERAELRARVERLARITKEER
jgi:hypothetical protein